MFSVYFPTCVACFFYIIMYNNYFPACRDEGDSVLFVDINIKVLHLLGLSARRERWVIISFLWCGANKVLCPPTTVDLN